MVFNFKFDNFSIKNIKSFLSKNIFWIGVMLFVLVIGAEILYYFSIINLIKAEEGRVEAQSEILLSREIDLIKETIENNMEMATTTTISVKSRNIFNRNDSLKGGSVGKPSVK